MRSITVFLLASGVCLSAFAGQPQFTAEVLADGVLFQANGAPGKSTVSLKGPGSYISKLEFEPGVTPFIDIHFVNGQPLADGLYKYEIVTAPAPKSSLTAGGAAGKRGPAVDRNAFTGMSGPKVSRVSGSFRVVNGVTVDPYLQEEPVNIGVGEEQR